MKCRNCKKKFTNIKLVEFIKKYGRKPIFCSRGCSIRFHYSITPKKRVTIICETCGKNFQEFPSELKFRKKIRFCSQTCAGISRLKQVRLKCADCDKSITKTPYQIKTYKNLYCNRLCAISAFRKNPPTKKNGWWWEDGYKVLYNKGNHIKEHIFIMQNSIGRKLGKDEIVHHKNGDKGDNRIENLEVMGRAEHASHHQKGVPEKKSRWWAKPP